MGHGISSTDDALFEKMKDLRPPACHQLYSMENTNNNSMCKFDQEHEARGVKALCITSIEIPPIC